MSARRDFRRSRRQTGASRPFPGGSRPASTRAAGLAGALALLSLTLATAACSRPPDADGEATVDLEIRQGLSFPDSDAGRAVEAHIEAMFAMGPGAEASYQQSLTALRARGPEAIATIMATYNEADRTLHSERAALVETLSELRMPEARDALMAVAHEALPERLPGPDDTISAIEPETIIRMTAIRGLGHLAIADDTAVRALAELASHRELPLSEQARQSLALVIEQEKDRERLQRLIALFPGQYQDWLPILGVAPPAPGN